MWEARLLKWRVIKRFLLCQSGQGLNISNEVSNKEGKGNFGKTGFSRMVSCHKALTRGVKDW